MSSEVRSVAKAIRLLDALAREPSSQGVTDLARQLDMDKSSVSRLLRTLEAGGLIEQDPQSRGYMLGSRLVHLGHRVMQRLDLRTLARPHLVQLAAETGECAHLAVLSHGQALYVEQAYPARGVNVDAPVGTLAPLYCTALGKALLAFQDPAEAEAILARMSFEAFTRRTITETGPLRSHLARVREEGVALDDEEFSVGVRCIAAPVLRHDRVVVGAVGISGPSPRITDSRLAEWPAIVRRRAQDLSAALGWEGEVEEAGSSA